jgi:alanine racemase
MDQIMVDTTALDIAPAPGDIATLLGTDGGQTVSATELADKSGTIPWEIFTGITRRVPRVIAGQ